MFVFRGCNIYWEIFIELYLLAGKYTERVEHKTCLGGRLLDAKGKTPIFIFGEGSTFFLTVLKACCCHCCCTVLTVLSRIR